MKDDALLKVTRALQRRLELALEPLYGGNSPVFVGPLNDADAGAATLILFLYRVVPNASLRNREHRVASAKVKEGHVFRNALPLDLYFLITVGTTPGASEEGLLQALGLAMQTMQAEPELTGPEVDYESIRVTLEPLSTEEASRIWALFPTANYRTSIAYVASPVWIDPRLPESAGEPVMEDQLFSGNKRMEVAV